jgi:predicted RecB family nuclease
VGAIDAMRTDALVSEHEAAALRRAVAAALEDTRAAEWFRGDWDVVRNEHDIVLPGDGRRRRPDRVMTRGRRAVVVDYKFGELEPEKYRRQIREYAELLRQMGYERTEGYLWFVRLQRIEKVV